MAVFPPIRHPERSRGICALDPTNKVILEPPIRVILRRRLRRPIRQAQGRLRIPDLLLVHESDPGFFTLISSLLEPRDYLDLYQPARYRQLRDSDRRPRRIRRAHETIFDLHELL